jgi:hypothetical protein
MKRILGLTLAVALVGAAFAVASQARNAHPRHGALHVTKECGSYGGQAGQFCTIVTSNLPAIPAGARVFYFEDVEGGALDSDLAFYAGPGNVALGHVVLSLSTFSGEITFDGGSGDFRGFHARAHVSYDADHGLWLWDGTYRFTGSGDDE